MNLYKYKKHEKLRKDFNNEFPPPMLLRQNQEKIADWWIIRMNRNEKSVRESVYKNYLTITKPREKLLKNIGDAFARRAKMKK